MANTNVKQEVRPLKQDLSAKAGLTKLSAFFTEQGELIDDFLFDIDEDDEDFKVETKTVEEFMNETKGDDDSENDAKATEEFEHETKVEVHRPGRKHRTHRTDYVYGAKTTASKVRRCGECENCCREDCGKCCNCKDKPKFGGRGTKKQACLDRKCLWKHRPVEKKQDQPRKHVTTETKSDQVPAESPTTSSRLRKRKIAEVKKEIKQNIGVDVSNNKRER